MCKVSERVKRKVISIILIMLMAVSLVIPASAASSQDKVTAKKITLQCTVNNDSVTLNWNAITHEKGVRGYYVYRSTTSGVYTIVPETDFWIPGTQYIDKKVTPGTTYYYIIKPVLGDGNIGDPSNEVKVYYPGTVNSITLSAKVNTGNITLEWTVSNPRNILGYYVFRSTKSGDYSNIPETDFWITGNSYVDNKVVPGTTYYYIVRPVLADRSLGSPSNEIRVTSQKIYGTISMTIGKAKMLVNGVWMEIDPGKATVPVLRNERTMLPIRALIEAMGGKVDYSQNEQKVTIKWNGKTVCLWIGKTYYTVDGVQKTMDVAPYISDTNRTMIPMRFVIESLGCSIDWDGSTMTATITYLLDGGSQYPPTPTGPPAQNWSGIWFTDRGKMDLVQNGIYITGTYGTNGTIEGMISGNKLIGTFKDNTGSGELEFVISPNGETFDGKYRTRQNQPWQKWNGKREKDVFTQYLRQLPSPADFSGTWDVKSLGKVVFHQQNNSVTGYVGSKDRITGTVVNNRLSGTYKKGGSSYLIEIFMNEDNKSFTGFWGTDQIARQDWQKFTGKLTNGH
ncbi:MAG TPA: hypothetical protein GX501_08015 [Clostridiaceae bacterium]|nr:hypothetical protein [Clostridiaceae bacterium]